MFCLLYSPKHCINTKRHVIDIFTSEDMENISLCIFQYRTLYYILKTYTKYANFARLYFRILQNFAILLILITEYLREFTFFCLDQKLVEHASCLLIISKL